MFQREKNSSLFLGGERTTGQDVRSSNGILYRNRPWNDAY